MPAPRKRRKEARPSEIVAAALHLFAERGFAATRLDDVAAAANISKGTLYLYFANKEELFKAVVRETVLPNIDRADALAAAHKGTCADLLRALMRHFASLLETEVAAVPKLIIAEAGNFPAVAEFYAETVVRRALAILASILERGMRSGEFRRLDVPTTLPLIVAPFLMMALWKHSLGRHTKLHFDASAVLATHVETLLRGLAAEPEPRGRR